MRPSPDQIRQAAYFRWQSRGGGHGRDRDDWRAAEQDLLFALNYRVLVQYRLDAPGLPPIGGEGRRVCRFCEQAEPRASFSDPTYVLPLPESFGNASLLARDRCDDCHAYLEGLAAEFEAFHRSLWPETAPTAISAPAFKGLIAMALSILPIHELDHFPDSVEWVLNPNHERDSPLFRGLGCYVHQAPTPFPAPWTVLARRVEEEDPFPYMLFFLGLGHTSFEAAVPLCSRDEEFDGGGLMIPQVATPFGPGRWPVESTSTFIPLAPAPPSRSRPRLVALPGG
ncbi:MAG: DUF2934 domain-containing protein [Isosphaeraceae bacterium]|nr:DUF2934 domain-containing protein [Isosphaeraceae bacterium]